MRSKKVILSLGLLSLIIYCIAIFGVIHTNKCIGNDLLNITFKLKQDINDVKLKKLICEADIHAYAIIDKGNKYVCPNREKPILYVVSEKHGSVIIIDITRKIVVSTLVILLSYLIIVAFILVVSRILKFIDIDIFKQLAEEKIVLVSSLQKGLTESLHHELMTPVSVIDIAWKDTITSIEELKIICKDGCDETVKDKASKIIDKITKYNESVTGGIEKIFDILALLSESKSIKYQNGNITIHDLISNVIKQTSLLSVIKPKINIIDPSKILTKRSVSRTLTNGGFSSIINNLINNSIEAKSTEITFEVIEYNKNAVHILYEDNGTGIRDCEGKLVKNTDVIFKYGYSSKVCSRHSRFKDWIIRTLGLVPPSTSRGFGMYITRSLLVNAGGDIKVVSTGKDGTKFLLIIPTNKT